MARHLDERLRRPRQEPVDRAVADQRRRGARACGSGRPPARSRGQVEVRADALDEEGPQVGGGGLGALGARRLVRRDHLVEDRVELVAREEVGESLPVLRKMLMYWRKPSLISLSVKQKATPFAEPSIPRDARRAPRTARSSRTCRRAWRGGRRARACRRSAPRPAQTRRSLGVCASRCASSVGMCSATCRRPSSASRSSADSAPAAPLLLARPVPAPRLTAPMRSRSGPRHGSRRRPLCSWRRYAISGRWKVWGRGGSPAQSCRC